MERLNPPIIGGFPSQRATNAVSLEVSLKVLNKLSICRWFKARWWRKCGMNIMTRLLSRVQQILKEKVWPTGTLRHCNADRICMKHSDDVIMGSIAPQITSLTIVYSIIYSDADQRKHQSSASLTFVRGIHRGPVNSPHKWPVTRKMFPFDDVIMTLPKLHGHRSQELHLFLVLYLGQAAHHPQR